jgi:ADP-ribose pyrophosphatase YjhB (NUDIX family)
VQKTAFHIGVSGHRDLGDEQTRAFVSEQVRKLLAQYRQQEQEPVLYSPLAIGADQLFVQTALELGIPVEAVVPCAAYETCYAPGSERETYHHLLHSCRTYHRLPYQDCSDDAYLAAGQWIVDHSDLVILIWNGQAAKGRGGTADVASYAWFAGRPFIQIDTTHHTTRTYTPSPLTGVQASFATPNQQTMEQAQGNYPERVLVLPLSQDDIVLMLEEYDVGSGSWQLTFPGGEIEATVGERLDEQIQRQLRWQTGYRAGTVEKLLDFYSHPEYVAHHVHTFVAGDLEWFPLEREAHKKTRVQTLRLHEALEATLIDDRCDPEAALMLWVYAQKKNRAFASNYR